MRFTSTHGRRGIPLFHHHKGHGRSVVLIEAPEDHHHAGSGAGLERWRAASYSDPWPDRA
jgi:hypothetical protein